MKTKLFFQTLIIALLGLSSVQHIAAQGCIPPPPGMLSWFPGDANPQDILDRTQDLWVTGNITFAPGMVGNAFTFDGSSDVIFSNINAGSAYTVDFWVRPSAGVATRGQQNLVGNKVEGTSAFGVIVLGSADQIEYYQRDGGTVLNAKVRSQTIPIGAWTHVALTYDGQRNRLYINGGLVPQNPGNGIYGTSEIHAEDFNNQLSLGHAIGFTAGNRLLGQLDEVEIFNRVLSESEIQAIVNAGSAGKCKAPVDADGDGVVNGRDACPGTPAGTPVNASGCPAGACFAPPANLNHWLPGDGSSQDILSNSDTLTATGVVTFTPGVVGQAFDFDGGDDLTYSTMSIGNAYTVDFWVRPSSTGPSGQRQNLIGNTLEGTTAFGLITFGNQQIEYFQSTAGSVLDAKVRGPQLPLDQWTHVTLTYDGQVNRLYINGGLVPNHDAGLYGTSAPHTEVFNNPLGLGNAAVANINARFVGQMDEVEVFSRALSQTEIRGIFYAAAAGKCKTLVDADGDGVVDIRDACPGTPLGTTVNASGCTLGACFPPPPGMTNWFPGDGNANDIRGSNNGTSSGGVTYPASKVAQGFNFDGTGDVTYSTINAGGAYTVDFWVRPSSSGPAIRQDLVGNYYLDGQNYGQITLASDAVEYFQGGGLRVATPAGSVPRDTYTHVALTYDGSVNRLYLNGNLAATSGVHAGETFNNPLRLGSPIINTGNPRFVGQLDEVEIFSRALSQTELRGIFYSDAAGKCKATPTPTPTPSGTLGNISTRMRVQTGENVIIGGFIIAGTDSKNVIIRGIGPSLSSFFSGVLANPTLELFQGNTLLQSNNDWKDTQRTEIEATGLQPSNDFESAILRTLPPGSYTAILRGLGNTTGIAVVEAYDLNQTANSKLANIATRGFVEAGDNVMIGGLIIGPAGGANARVVLRAIGPSLTAFGIAGALQDPTMELKDSNGATLMSNNDWGQGQSAELQLLGLAPTDPRESALIATLAPGAYTAIVRGAGNTAGVGLVEVYHVQ